MPHSVIPQLRWLGRVSDLGAKNRKFDYNWWSGRYQGSYHAVYYLDG